MPLYMTIFETLKGDIEQGRYTRVFPSEAQLVKRFKASRQTVIRAMSELVKAGLVERRRGSGTVVSRRVRHALGRVGLLLPTLFSSPFTTAFAGVCHEEGYKLLFRDLSASDPGGSGCRDIRPIDFIERAAAARAIALEMAAAKVSGVLMQPVQGVPEAETLNREILSAFRRRHIPVVLVDHDICPAPERSQCDLVSLDNFQAGYAVGRHLIERGARKIVFMPGRCLAPSVMARLHGLSAAVAEAGLEWSPARNVIGCSADDAAALGRLLKKLRPDAIACGNDINAARVLKRLQSVGVKVPGQVRLTGFDDAPHAALLTPALTTVRQDFTRIARAAAQRLAWRIHHPDEPPMTLHLHGELIVREST